MSEHADNLAVEVTSVNGKAQSIVVNHVIDNARLEFVFEISAGERKLTITGYDGDEQMLSKVSDLTHLWEDLTPE